MNVSRVIRPKDKLIFHLWFQILQCNFKVNIYIVNKDSYLTNDQDQGKYDFLNLQLTENQINHVEEYGPHLINFKHDWEF